MTPPPSRFTRSSQRMAAIQMPIIPTVGELIRTHPGAISLGQGVVFYGPPPSAIERVRRFLETPEHKYGAVQGMPELVQRLTKKLRDENQIDCQHGYRVVVTAGANMGFINALFAITDPGDEVILLTPYYFNQEMAIRMLNCTPVLVSTDARHQPVLERLRAAITPRTRAIVTISPNNPSGAVYPEATLREINQLCREHGLYHISDEAYENFVYGTTPHFSPGSLPGAESHTISLYSLSKAYGFASWRIGYMVLPEHLHLAVMKAQDTNLICAPLISQHAALGALETGSSYCREKLQTIAAVRALLLRELEKLAPRCAFANSSGALYVLVKVDTRLDGMALAERLIREFGVAVIPGSAFGIEDSCTLRVSFGALAPTTATQGIQRLVDGLRAISAG
jgi:aspartate/methionine/tyrosine aminotransferase